MKTNKNFLDVLPKDIMSDFITQFKAVELSDSANVSESCFPELNAEQSALAAQFTTLSSRFSEPENLVLLNDSLRTKTFVAGNVASKADLTAFAEIYPVASKLDAAKFRHILRWVDLVQNTLVNVEKVVLNLDTEVAREVKEKKKAEKKEDVKEAKVEPTKEEAKKVKDVKNDSEKVELTDEEKKRKADIQKEKKAAKAKAKAEANANKPAAAPKAPAGPVTPSLVSFKVGFIQKAIKHPDADSLYVSTIDIGEEEPRTVCSGLVKYVPIEEMQQRYVITIANFKPVTMRGVKSTAMVLCASNENGVEFVNPPAGSKPGDKLFFEGFDGEPEKQLNPKKKVWESVQPFFSTNANFEVTYTEEGKEPRRLVNAKGELCKNATFVNAEVK